MKQLRRKLRLPATELLLLTAALNLRASLFPYTAFAQTEIGGTAQAVVDGAGAAPTLKWSKTEKFDQGRHTFVAMNASGFLVEVHESEQFFSTGLYYHLGRLNAADGSVQWGPSRRFSFAGAWPAVAISDEGYVIMTRSSAAYKCCSDLDYYVGTVQLNGDLKQEINFKKDQVQFDSGFHNGLAINAAGMIAEVHESGSGGRGLYYRLGHLKNPVGGDFSIEWNTGDKGIKYDDGVNPRVSMNDNGDVVEVHGVSGEGFLHYTRGKLQTDRIAFRSEHPRYDDQGIYPSVALLNDSTTLETNDGTAYTILYRTGVLSLTDASKIA